jgi:hypothetical protein
VYILTLPEYIGSPGRLYLFLNQLYCATALIPAGVKAVAQYNWLRNKYNLPGDPIYSGKVKIYTVKSNNKKGEERSFAFLSQRYPKWADQYAPIDRTKMFEKMFLDPLNRITQGSMGLPALSADGYIQTDLFGF